MVKASGKRILVAVPLLDWAATQTRPIRFTEMQKFAYEHVHGKDTWDAFKASDPVGARGWYATQLAHAKGGTPCLLDRYFTKAPMGKGWIRNDRAHEGKPFKWVKNDPAHGARRRKQDPSIFRTPH